LKVAAAAGIMNSKNPRHSKFSQKWPFALFEMVFAGWVQTRLKSARQK
jgi:hypothetical protein